MTFKKTAASVLEGKTLRPQDIERLQSKEWRLNHLYKIQNKRGESVKFKLNRMQEDFCEKKASRNIICKSRQLGFCLDPKTKILTADLRWVEIQNLAPGQEIISVDEFPIRGPHRGRQMKTGKVEAVIKVKRKAYNLIFDDGRSVTCTAPHPWLSKQHGGSETIWRSIERRPDLKGKVLEVGDYVRWITKPWGEQTIEDGWFSGILDGEGSMDKTTAKKSPGVNASQLEGSVWDRMIKYAQDEGYNYHIENDDTPRKTKYGRSPVPKLCFGRMDEIFKLLGKSRPTRFGARRFWEKRDLPGKKTGIGWSKVVFIEELSEQTMIDLQTSTGTYIAEGFVSHNTTLEAIDMLDDVLFTKNFDALMLSYDQTSQLDIFDHKIGFAWENFPLKQLYQVESDRANKLKFNFGDGTFSSITVKTQGRSGTFQRLHVSEYGLICREEPTKALEIISGTIPSVPFHGRVDIESTARGEIGMYHDMFWEAFNRGEPTAPTEYKAHFYNWTWDDDEISRVEIMAVPMEFQKIQKLHNLTEQQISYYYLKFLSLNKNWSLLQENYPTTPEEAFISSGEKLFDREKLKEFETREGVKMGDWTYFEPYRTGHTYAIGADPSEGVGGDNAAAVVFDFTPLRPKVVATYKSKHCPPDLFAYELRNGGNQYGSALIAVERNNHGHATLLKLREIYNQSLIYREIREGRLKVRETDRFGWNTNASTKPRMIFDLVTAVNEDLLDIPSKDLLFEMRTYDRIDLDHVDRKDEHLGHWDLLTACAIGFQMKGHRVGRQIQVITSSSRSNVHSAI